MQVRRWTLALAGLAVAALTGCSVADLYDLVSLAPGASAPESDITRVVAARLSTLDEVGNDVGSLTVIDAKEMTFRVREGGGLVAEGEMSQADLLGLQSVLETAGFYDLDADYSPLGGCCGVVYYVISVERGDEVFSVRTLSTVMPEAFRQVLDHIESMTVQAR